MIKKDVKAIINVSGNGGVSTRVSIPAEWARILGIDKENKELEMELTENKEIVIRKKIKKRGVMKMRKIENILANTSIEELVAAENNLHWDGNGSKQHYEGVVKELLEKEMNYDKIIDEVEKSIVKDTKVARLLERIFNKIEEKSMKTGAMGTETVAVDLEVSDEELETFKEIDLDNYDGKFYWEIDENIISINFSEE